MHAGSIPAMAGCGDVTRPRPESSAVDSENDVFSHESGYMMTMFRTSCQK